MQKVERMSCPEPVLLLVEDEFLIREILDENLTEAGFVVVAVGSATEAYEELADNVSRFRAVVTDIRLGEGPDGWDIARRARQLASDMPVVYISGDSAGDWASKGVPKSVMIGKPFATGQIVTAVATLINDADSH